MGCRTLLLCLWFGTFAAQAGDAVLDRATLKGIAAVGVIVDQLPPEFPAQGVSADALATRLAQRLRDAHITVDNSAKEFVGLRASSVQAGKGSIAAAMTIGLYQPVTLVRDPAVRVAPQTWEVDTVMMAGPKLLYRAAMESVDDLAARFVAAYRSVNPE